MPQLRPPRRALRHTVATLVSVFLSYAAAAAGQAPATETRADSVGRRRIQPLPALGSSPETGLQYGGTVMAVWEPAPRLRTRPTALYASALRTAKSQSRVRLDGDHWTTGNARRIAGTLLWQEFPLPYFGIGDDTPKSAEEIFVPQGTEAILIMQQRIASSWYASGGLRYVNQRIRTDTAGELQRGDVTGSIGGTIAEVSAGVIADTRDNLFAPSAGHWLQLSHARSAKAFGSSFSYGTTRLDARTYRDIGARNILAAQLQVTRVDGDAPFDQYALVGNSDILRGYPRGRYRDRLVAAAQGEYRSPTWHRFGAVLFAGAGVAAPALDAIGDSRVLPSYGAGARFELDRRQHTGVRADYGRGIDGAAGLYLGFNQAF